MANFHSSNANRVKGNDIDPDADGRVEQADHAASADNATTADSATSADSATTADELGSNYPNIADPLGFTSEGSTSQTTGSKSGEAWRVGGAKSDLLMTVQAGNGRVAITWNAYYDGSDWRYIVDNEAATLLGIGNMDPGGTNGSNVAFANAPTGTADGIINWNSTHVEDGVFTGDADTVDGQHASDLGGSTLSNTVVQDSTSANGVSKTLHNESYSNFVLTNFYVKVNNDGAWNGRVDIDLTFSDGSTASWGTGSDYSSNTEKKTPKKLHPPSGENITSMKVTASTEDGASSYDVRLQGISWT